MTFRRAYLVVLAATIALLSSACEEDVVAVLGTDSPFTLFGVFTPQLDTQWVRVYTIDGVLEPIPPTPLDARFESRSGSGEVRVWTDSILTEHDGMFAHVFYSPFTAAYGETYAVRVATLEGNETTVQVDVPPFSKLILPEQTVFPPAVLPVVVTGNPPSLLRVEVIYEYKYRSFSGIERQKTAFSYDDIAEPGADGWVINIQINRDFAVIRALIKDATGLDVEPKMVQLIVRLIVANKEWKPPGGSFDPEILVEPGTLSNVNNGFGFVGAGFRLEESWAPFDTILVKKPHDPSLP